VEGLDFFFFLPLFRVVFSLLSREKEKVEPMVRAKEKLWPLLASAWQNVRH
jgi:hypothetical protein